MAKGADPRFCVKRCDCISEVSFDRGFTWGNPGKSGHLCYQNIFGSPQGVCIIHSTFLSTKLYIWISRLIKDFGRQIEPYAWQYLQYSTLYMLQTATRAEGVAIRPAASTYKSLGHTMNAIKHTGQIPYHVHMHVYLLWSFSICSLILLKSSLPLSLAHNKLQDGFVVTFNQCSKTRKHFVVESSEVFSIAAVSSWIPRAQPSRYSWVFSLSR